MARQNATSPDAISASPEYDQIKEVHLSSDAHAMPKSKVSDFPSSIIGFRASQQPIVSVRAVNGGRYRIDIVGYVHELHRKTNAKLRRDMAQPVVGRQCNPDNKAP